MPSDLIIEGKVAAILNSRELVLNIGESDGVEVGMYFKIMDKESREIVDPDTGLFLGRLDSEKVRVRVNRVQDKIAVAITYKNYSVNVGGTGSSVSHILGLGTSSEKPPRWITHYETLKQKSSEFEPLDEKDSVIKVGDVAIQFLNDEDTKNETD